jgi:hypothetical protein
MNAQRRRVAHRELVQSKPAFDNVLTSELSPIQPQILINENQPCRAADVVPKEMRPMDIPKKMEPPS